MVLGGCAFLPSTLPPPKAGTNAPSGLVPVAPSGGREDHGRERRFPLSLGDNKSGRGLRFRAAAAGLATPTLAANRHLIGGSGQPVLEETVGYEQRVAPCVLAAARASGHVSASSCRADPFRLTRSFGVRTRRTRMKSRCHSPPCCATARVPPCRGRNRRPFGGAARRVSITGPAPPYRRGGALRKTSGVR